MAEEATAKRRAKRLKKKQKFRQKKLKSKNTNKPKELENKSDSVSDSSDEEKLNNCEVQVKDSVNNI